MPRRHSPPPRDHGGEGDPAARNAQGRLSGIAAKALGLNFLSTILAKFGLTGFGVLLARLLGPHQYGEVAVAMTALLAILSFNELGVSLAIVRWPDDPEDIVPTVTTISVATSAFLYGVAFLIAPAFASAMGSPASTPIIRVMSLMIITNGIASVPAAVLQRQFLQGRQMIADQAHGWIGAVTSVVLAERGGGPMSLAIGQVTGAVAGCICLIAFCPVRLRFGLHRPMARKLLAFGLPLAGSSLIVFLVGNVDNFIAGHLLGPTALGFYVLAWNLASLPVNIFSQPVRSVAPAFFSRLQSDPLAMRRGFTSVAGLLSSVTLPVCFAISGCALQVVTLIYGGKWAAAAQPLSVLAILAAVRIIFELAYDYFVVLAKSRVVLGVQLGWLLTLVPALVIGAHLYGVAGVALAGLLVALVVVLPWYMVELSRVRIPVGALARRMLPPILLSLVVWVIARSIAKVVTIDLAVIAAAGIVGMSVIVFLCYTMRGELRQLRNPESAVEEPSGTDTETAAQEREPAPTSSRVAITRPVRIVLPSRHAAWPNGGNGMAARVPRSPVSSDNPTPLLLSSLVNLSRTRPQAIYDTVAPVGWGPLLATRATTPLMAVSASPAHAGPAHDPEKALQVLREISRSQYRGRKERL